MVALTPTVRAQIPPTFEALFNDGCLTHIDLQTWARKLSKTGSTIGSSVIMDDKLGDIILLGVGVDGSNVRVPARHWVARDDQNVFRVHTQRAFDAMFFTAEEAPHIQQGETKMAVEVPRNARSTWTMESRHVQNEWYGDYIGPCQFPDCSNTPQVEVEITFPWGGYTHRMYVCNGHHSIVGNYWVEAFDKIVAENTASVEKAWKVKETQEALRQLARETEKWFEFGGASTVSDLARIHRTICELADFPVALFVPAVTEPLKPVSFGFKIKPDVIGVQVKHKKKPHMDALCNTELTHDDVLNWYHDLEWYGEKPAFRASWSIQGWFDMRIGAEKLRFHIGDWLVRDDNEHFHLYNQAEFDSIFKLA